MNRLYINKDWSTLKKLIAIKAAGGGEPLVEYTATGNPATFETNVIAPMKLLIPFAPVQDLHGYDNPWPGGGGKNLFDAEHPNVTSSNGVNYVYNPDGSITLSGTANSNASLFFFTLPNEIPSGSYVTWSLNNSDINSEIGVRLVRRESGSIANWGTAAYADFVNKTLTVTPTGYNANEINVFVKTNHGAVSEITLKIQCEIGSEATEWTPYANICPISGWTGAEISHSGSDTSTPTVYAITFPDSAGTVYGGTLTVNKDGTGTLVCDKAVFTIPKLASGDIKTSTLAGSTGKYALISTTGLKVIPTSKTESIFEAVKCVSFTRRGQAWEGCLSSSAISHMVFVPSNATLAEINSALQGTKIVATLATPVTYNLTELEVIETLNGVNNVWTDTNGTNTVKYLKKG